MVDIIGGLEPYWPFFLGIIAGVNFIYFIGKFFYNRYVEGLDNRICGAISKATDGKIIDHEKRIGTLESSFKILKDFFIPNKSKKDDLSV